VSDLLDLPEELVLHNPWSATDNPVWLLTLFECRRNIARSNFPSKLSLEESRKLAQLVEAPLSAFLAGRGRIFPAQQLAPLDKEFLCEHFFCAGFQNAGIGQSFALDLEGRFFGQINLEDHVRMQWVDTGSSWEKTWEELARCEEMIGKELLYAFSAQFGFLTANPKYCGTGLKVSALLHLPALIMLKKLEEILLPLEDIEVIGLEGMKEGYIAEYLILKNGYTLGLSEQEILRAVHLAATKLTQAESEARSQIQSGEFGEIKDAVGKAYGLLIHSYQLTIKEALSALSHLKLGRQLGWVGGIEDRELNALFLAMRRAHLIKSGKEKYSESDFAHQRALFIHSKLATLELKEGLV
jgi:protein arginine kinase